MAKEVHHAKRKPAPPDELSDPRIKSIIDDRNWAASAPRKIKIEEAAWRTMYTKVIYGWGGFGAAFGYPGGFSTGCKFLHLDTPVQESSYFSKAFPLPVRLWVPFDLFLNFVS